MSQINKSIGLIGLTISGMTCMIGSGWLFGSYKAAKLAGPAAIYAWIIGGIAILCIALSYIELGAMLPRMGGMVRYLNYTHGGFAGFLTAWTNWLAIVTVIPVEAVASVQYFSSWPWPWAHHFFDAQTTALSTSGLWLASIFLVFYFFVNYWSVRFFIRFMTLITIFKVAVPLLTIIGLCYSTFHPTNFTSVHHSFMPYGWMGVFTAVSTSGILFAFHGFQTIINLSGEAKNPGRNIPLAITFAIICVALIYVALQIAFVGALDPAQIVNGWEHLILSSPFAQLAIALNLQILAISLYIDAVISPSGTATTYMATTTRMLYGMGKNGHMPSALTKLHQKYHIPRNALWTNFCVGFLFLWIFRGWEHLVPVVSLTGVISYITGPVAVIALRQLAKDYKRPIRIAALSVFAPIAFIIISLLLYWGHWPLTAEVILIIASGLGFYFYYQAQQGWPQFRQQVKSGTWFVAYLFGIAALSYLGSSEFSGINFIPYGWDMLAVAIFSLAIYFWAIKSAWLTPMLSNILAGTVVDEDL